MFTKTLPGRRRWKEAVADAISHPLEWINLADDLIARAAPDMREYWNPDSQFGSEARWPLTEALRDALDAQYDIILVTHSLGTMIAYDVLWKLSHYGEYREIAESGHKVSRWITLGSPLGNPTVAKNLKGSRARKQRRFPTLVARWLNLAAEDDYVSHDETLGDDFAEMRKLGLVSQVLDRKIYNMSVRLDRQDDRTSNPHHGAGYLVSPPVADFLAEWLLE